MTTGRPLSPEMTRVRAIVLANPTMPPAQIVKTYGIPAWRVCYVRMNLIASGDVASLRPKIDIDAIRERIEDGALARAAAQTFGVSTDALYKRLCRAGMTVRDLRAEMVFSGRDIARLCGWSHRWGARRIARWRAAGLLDARRSTRAGSQWRVTASAWMAFLDRPDCPLAPEQIAASDWREYRQDALNRAHLRRRKQR